MRRKERQTSKEVAQEIIDKSTFATLAMTDLSGNPYCIPITIVRLDDNIYFHGATEGKKIDCLKNNSHVCISCVSHAENIQEKFTVNYKSAVVFGTANEITDTSEKMNFLEFLCKRHTPDNMSNFKVYAEKGIARTSIWKVTIEEITGKANNA